MNNYIINKLKQIEHRHKELENLLSNPTIINNKNDLFVLSKEYKKLNNIYDYFQRWKQLKQSIINTQSLLIDNEISSIAKDEINKLNFTLNQLEKKIIILLLPKDSDDECGCLIELRAGTGGSEASIFTGDLFRMYSKYSEINGWNIEIVSTNLNDLGGYKEIISKISSEGAYAKLKFESGGHRVQRVPETESQGRIHTSSCTVVVMPLITEHELPEINSNDLRIDTFKSSGAGGQHVNTTDSAIRVIHLPTGLIVECQDERSQHKNKAKAISILNARLRTIEKNRRKQEESSTRRNLLTTGDRSYRIRTYNFPQGRVTDHRIGLTIYKLTEIMEGHLEFLINPIINKYKEDQISSFQK